MSTTQGIVRTRAGDLRWGPRPRLVGVVNVTPDSFSDGGRFVDPRDAVDHGLRLRDAGADLLDVGGMSTRPGSRPVTIDEELRRVLPVIEGITRRIALPVSVDTCRAEVFRRAFEAGAAMLNDVTAFGDPEMMGLLADTGAPAVVMHMLGVPATMQDDPHYEDVVSEVRRYLEEVVERAVGAGIERSQLIVDPGIGFGKTLADNLALLRGIDELKEIGCPILVGTSRKSFLGKIVGRSDPLKREYATVATTAYLFAKGVAFLRVHDVEASADAVKVLAAIGYER